MSFDGFVVSAIVEELNSLIPTGKIEKIYQPELDEINILFRSLGKNYRLLLSSHSNYSRAHLTNINKENPMTPPSFCMLLRKNLTGGRIISVSQPNFERIIQLDIEVLDELNIKKTKSLIIEMMGKHSNIILVDKETNKIIDSIRRISFDMSRFRQVFPGLPYETPPINDKLNPLHITSKEMMLNHLKREEQIPVYKSIYLYFTGVSPLLAREICHRAQIDMDTPIANLKEEELLSLFTSFQSIMELIKVKAFKPTIYEDLDKNKYVDYSAIEIDHFNLYEKISFESISMLLENFYSVNDHKERMKQKTQVLRKNVTIKLERLYNKIQNLQRDYNKALKGEKYKVIGDLITANIYRIEKGQAEIEVENFYSEDLETIKIELDKRFTPSKNAQVYYKKYNKSKNALVEVDKQIKITNTEIRYLEQILISVDQCTSLQDLDEILTELIDNGYIKKKITKGKQQVRKGSGFLTYISTDGFTILVGKNNKQNEDVTFKQSTKTDIWLHVKDMPGSHVIIKLEDKELTDIALLEAATLAAYYSKAKDSSKVAVDYTERRNVKKPSGSKPGMVIYENYSTILVDSFEKDISKLKVDVK